MINQKLKSMKKVMYTFLEEYKACTYSYEEELTLLRQDLGGRCD